MRVNDRQGEPTVASAGGTVPGQVITPESVGIGQLFWRVPEAVVATDVATGLILLWNPAAERMFGYRVDEAIGQSLEILIPERLKQQHREGLARYHATGHGRIVNGGHPVEVTALHRSGAELEVELSLSALDAPAGRRIVLALIRDVGERNRAARERAQLAEEHAARIEAERVGAELAAVVESIPAAVYVGDGDGIHRANRAALDMLGLDALDELNCQPVELWRRIEARDPRTGAPMPADDDLFRRALRGETVVRELLIRHGKTGQDRLLRSAAAPVTMGKRIVGAVVVGSDITETRRAEQELHLLAEAGSRFAASLDLEATLAGVVGLAVPAVADWAAVYLVQGGHACRVAARHADPAEDARLAAEPSELELGTAMRGGPPSAADEDSGPDRAAAFLATERGRAALLAHLRVPDGDVFLLAARGQPFGALVLGRGTGASVDRDFAELLAARAAVAIDNARLYREVQDAVRTRDEFLASASHDLKTPLTAIHGQAELLELRIARQVPPPENERLATGLGKIRGVARRMAAIVNELMDAARLRTGRPLALERRTIDLVQLAQTLAAEAQSTTSRHHVRIECELPEVIGRWDGFRIERVLGNLLSNAIKYSPAGGEIVVRVGRSGDDAVISVRDEGVGVPAEDLPRLFERYHRGRNVIGRVRGAGIGLAGVKQIVAQHGGSIAVQSQEGRGSTFTVRLPMWSN